MVKPKPWARIATQLDGCAFGFPRPGRVVLSVAGASTLRALDDDWSRAPARALMFHWYNIGSRAADRFVVRDDEHVIASWAGTPSVQLRDGLAYRLDFLEVSPTTRGQRIGTAVMHLVAARARETGCSFIVLGAHPTAVGFYASMGSVRCPKAMWSAPPGMVALMIPAESCGTMADVADALRD